MFRYQLIAKELEDSIAAGELRPGDMLPSTSELRAEYKVSYGSVRDAILILKAKGLVEGRQGVGVFVK